jgi:hypothetical protein
MTVRTTLDPQVERDLLQALAELPVVAAADGRMNLLAGLDNTFKLSIPRSPVPLTDLQNIVEAAAAYVDPAQQRWGLAELLNNALDLAAGTQIAARLITIHDQLIPTPGQLDFSRVAAVPPVPEAQYVASDCRVEPATSLPIQPTSDDRDYLDTVRDRYRSWRDAADYRFISGAIIPPTEFVPGDVLHRRVPNQGGPTVQLWSLCRANEELMDHRRLLVLGRPGVGKTSLIQFLARQYTDVGGLLLPVIVSLRSWNDPPDKQRDLLQFIKDFLVTPADRKAYPRGAPLAANLETYLNTPDLQRRLIFLLDDFNRMPQDDAADYQRRLGAIRDFCDEYYRAIVVVVSRSLDYDGGLADCDPEFEVVEVNPWGPAQIAEYMRRNAPDLLPYARDPRVIDLGEIPAVLGQLVEVIRAMGVPAPGLFHSAQALLQAFVDRLFAFSEQAGRGDPTMRAQVQEVLSRLAVGLQRDNKRGSYVPYAQAVGYIMPAPAVDADHLVNIAADATILDIVVGSKQLGFEGQELEDYFAALAANDGQGGAAPTPTALNATLSSGQPDAALQVARALDQAGMLSANATTGS